MYLRRIFFAVFSAVLLVGAGCQPMARLGTPSSTSTMKQYSLYHEINQPAGFVNTDKITLGELVGKKVILVDFVTYSCINCIRTFPYLVDWYGKYKEKGLEIVAIHTPEFAFEHKKENVEAAMKKFGITFPVVLDNAYGTWRAYGNNYWPRKYLIDIHGNIVYDHIGEGAYDETEKKIQEALEERMTVLGIADSVAVPLSHPSSTVGTELGKINSPEIYFGSERNEYLGNGTEGKSGKQTLTIPVTILPNTLYLGGIWDVAGDHATTVSQPAKLIFRYTAKQVNMVASADTTSTVRVQRDGRELGDAAGSDVSNGVVTIRGERLYEFINDPAGYAEHTIEIEIDQPGVKVFTFTFG